MKRFLWFNVDKLKTDIEYFLVSSMLLILIQLLLYFPLKSPVTNNYNWRDIILGFFWSIFFLYMLTMKKEFTLKEVWKCLWKL